MGPSAGPVAAGLPPAQAVQAEIAQHHAHIKGAQRQHGIDGAGLHTHRREHSRYVFQHESSGHDQNGLRQRIVAGADEPSP